MVLSLYMLVFVFSWIVTCNDVVQLVLGNCHASTMLVDKNARKNYLHLLKFFSVFLWCFTNKNILSKHIGWLYDSFMAMCDFAFFRWIYVMVVNVVTQS
jgi:hypothetical protein